MVHPVKKFRKLKVYILSKRLGNSSGLSFQNTKETEVVHPIKTQVAYLVQTLRRLKWYVKTRRSLKWYTLSKHLGNSRGTSVIRLGKSHGTSC